MLLKILDSPTGQKLAQIWDYVHKNFSPRDLYKMILLELVGCNAFFFMTHVSMQAESRTWLAFTVYRLDSKTYSLAFVHTKNHFKSPFLMRFPFDFFQVRFVLFWRFLCVFGDLADWPWMTRPGRIQECWQINCIHLKQKKFTNSRQHNHPKTCPNLRLCFQKFLPSWSGLGRNRVYSVSNLVT